MDTRPAGFLVNKVLSGLSSDVKAQLAAGAQQEAEARFAVASAVELVCKELKPFWVERDGRKTTRRYVANYNLLHPEQDGSRRKLCVALSLPDGESNSEYVVPLRSFQGAGGMTVSQPGLKKVYVHGLRYLYPNLPCANTLRKIAFFKTYSGPWADWVKASFTYNLGADGLYNKLLALRTKGVRAGEPAYMRALVMFLRHSRQYDRLKEKASSYLPRVSGWPRVFEAWFSLTTWFLTFSLVPCLRVT